MHSLTWCTLAEKDHSTLAFCVRIGFAYTQFLCAMQPALCVCIRRVNTIISRPLLISTSNSPVNMKCYCIYQVRLVRCKGRLLQSGTPHINILNFLQSNHAHTSGVVQHVCGSPPTFGTHLLILLFHRVCSCLSCCGHEAAACQCYYTTLRRFMNIA